MRARATMDNARGVLREVFGFEEFRPGQSQAVGALLKGKDALVLLPTGAGKSLCFQVPGLTLARAGKGPTLVISPLIALMHDQVQALVGRGVAAAAVNSHQSDDEAAQTLKAFATGKLEMLYVSPERAAQPEFREVLRQRRVGMFAIDEAHCVSQWGHDFRPEYMQLAELRELSPAPMVAVTATATRKVLEEIRTQLQLSTPEVVRGDFRRPNLAFSVEHISAHSDRIERLVTLLDEAGMRRSLAGKAIVYCSTRKHTEKVAKALVAKGFAARHYHAGRTKEARDKAQSAFGANKLRVLVATNAFGMGIDFPDVRLVLHYQTPGSLEAYYQEAGRAGRDQQNAKCVMFFGPEDLATQRRISSGDADGGGSGLEAVERYALASRCREQGLCEHFGIEEPLTECGRCDVCTDSVAEASLSPAASTTSAPALAASDVATILDAVDALSRPVGKTVLARALRGSRAKTVKKLGLLKIPQHGALKNLEERAIVGAIERCLESGELIRRGDRFPTVWLPGKPVEAPTTETSTSPRTASANSPSRKKTSSFDTRRYSPLMGALERFRQNKARELNWKLFMVMQKRTMLAIDSERPTTLRALAKVAGLGPVKVQRFGKELLKLVLEHR